MFSSVDDLINMIPQKWRDICDKEIFKEYYWKNIINVLNNCEYYPTKQDIFKVFELIDPENVKVVIIGQDPYIKENQAMGLSFSVKNGVHIPPSLRNVYKEILTEYFPNENIKKILTDYNKRGDLSEWCKEGVLLLNSVLTVKKEKSNSHKNIGWEEFTSHIISKLDSMNKIVFMAWGNNAKAILDDNVKRNYILYSGHPSPLNYSNPFVGCNCFLKCNMILEKEYKLQSVNWLCLFNI